MENKKLDLDEFKELSEDELQQINGGWFEMVLFGIIESGIAHSDQFIAGFKAGARH
jgi:bacteriocin-like protein